MYHVETIDIRQGDADFPYADYASLSSNNMFNVSNFYTRNLMTGLKKTEKEWTENEQDVIRAVTEAIPSINSALKDKYNLKVANIIKDKRLTDKEKKEKAGKVKLNQYAMPTKDHWFVGATFLETFFSHTKNPDYTAHHSHLVQKAIEDCQSAWKSFFEQPAEGNGLGKKKIPGYRKSGGRSTAKFTNIGCKIEHKLLRFPYALLPGEKKKRRMVLDVSKLPHASKDKLIEVRIVPYFGGYQVQIVTDDGISENDLIPKEEELFDENGNPAGAMMLDPGVNNFATITDNKGNFPIIIKGGALKARNQWFNKKISRLRSELMKGKDPKKNKFPASKQMQRVSRKREAFIKDTFYKYAHAICRLMKERELSFLIIGHNKGQKNSMNMGHQNNQTFAGIPFTKFHQIIKTVAVGYGIRVIIQEESYTSKACFAAGDFIPTHGESSSKHDFSGKRIKRGLYRDCNDMILNADVNGAANIGRKYHPDIFKGQADISYLYGPVAVWKHTDIIPRPKAPKKYSR